MKAGAKLSVFKFAVASLAALAAGTATIAVLPLLWQPDSAFIVRSTGKADIGGPFTLASSDGRTVTERTFRGKWLALFFGYTFCPDVCPTTLNNMSMAIDALGADADKLQPAFVSVDPKRDTPQSLAEYLKSFSPKIVGLTGRQEQIDRIVKSYRVYVSKQESDEAGEYLVAHSAYIYLMDPSGKFANVIQGTEDGKEIAAWLRREMER